MRIVLLILLASVTIGLNGQNTEQIKLDWKKKKGWKIAYKNEVQGISTTEYIKKKEKLENWTELVTIQKLNFPNTSGIPLETLMNAGFEEAKKNAPEAKLHIIEKNENVEYPWIEYKVEVPRYLNDPTPESQFFHVVKGKSSVFLIWWAVKKDKITEEEIYEWQEFFKTTKMK